MLENIASSLERSMRNFFWEGHKGGKLNHLAKWELVTKDLKDGGLGLGNVRSKNVALLSKWGWRFTRETEALWCLVIKSIHGSGLFNWHTNGEGNGSLRSLWTSISKQWLKMEVLVKFKVGNWCRISFWQDPWIDKLPRSSRFPNVFKIAAKPKGSVAEYRGPTTSSWDISLRRQLKDEEIIDFQQFTTVIANKSVLQGSDRKSWSLEPNGIFQLNS